MTVTHKLRYPEDNESGVRGQENRRLACGCLSGLLISRFNIPAILATLGTQQLFTGIAIGITAGRPQSRLPLLYSQIGNTEFFNFVPLPFVLYFLIAIVIGLVLCRARFGTHVYMLGTNARAARFAGLNNASILLRTYMISGCFLPLQVQGSS